MQHLAMIMDGNRRWAKNNKMQAMQGHKHGLDALERAAKFCIDQNIKYLSLYTFSIENFNRSETEKKHLFGLLNNMLTDKLDDFIKQNIRLRFVGDRSLFPDEVRSTILNAEEKTKDLVGLQINFLFCYGAKQEITAAARRLAQQVKDGTLSVDDIDEKHFEDALWTEGIPRPDLLVRTGGASRLSNFLLYQSAYSEFQVLDIYWPEISEAHLAKCLEKFQNTQRNFGH